MKKYTIMFLCLSALLVSSVCPGVYGRSRSDIEGASPVSVLDHEDLADLGNRVERQRNIIVYFFIKHSFQST